MHAVILREFGPAENLTYESVEDPVPGEGEVRVAVRAAGVHLIETLLRTGVTIGPPVPRLPTIFGGEVAGVVDAVGPGVDGSWLGRRVVTGRSRPGGYAELSVAAVESLHVVPDELGFEQAVAMIVTGATTMALIDLAAPAADDVVLVNSAAGGIGRLLVQHARNIGAEVVGAAGGPAKVAKVQGRAVDYDVPGWSAQVGEVSLVFDGVGGSRGREAFSLLRRGGRHIVYGNASREETAGPAPEELKARDITSIYAIERILSWPGGLRGLEERALAAAASGQLSPEVHPFPLAEAAAAHAALESRATTGKVVLIP
ncbi:zinc-binding dehydrogenase [Nonomuraea africana]|uniref:NADPH2:quinone reductase n=1 Tax=Nonomuraea africana TaxID=46171 RepID=A0ABR9KID7_9ACTN|nr:zinc-binding dehydrogenase [Nonomuraea africana]MBE1561749.1 NADPH2:quinone reductase [Nonomuraea africana]